jgi:D-alanyl-D-alanine carboxypeptidase
MAKQSPRRASPVTGLHIDRRSLSPALLLPVPAAALLVLLVVGLASGVSTSGSTPLFEPSYAVKLRLLIAAKLSELRVPGAIVYVETGSEGPWTATFGTSDLKTNTPMADDLHMRIGSITKTLTATAILQLVDDGKLNLDDPVSKYQSEVPNGQNITIRQLLDMTSGLYNYSEDPGFNQTLDSDSGKVWDLKDLLAIGFTHEPYFAPGQGWHYSNTNYILLGEIIEQLSGKLVEQVFQQRIFDQLGMADSLLPERASAAIPTPHSQGYMYGTNVETSQRPALAGDAAAKANAEAGAPRNVTDENVSAWTWTAGSATSTLHDLKIWSRALADGMLLTPETHQEQLKSVATSNPQLRYGLGILDIASFVGHNGQIPGYQSYMGYSPQRDATIIVLTNVFAAPDGTEPADAITQLIIQQLFS